ncbi:MAG: endonuclease domain-containing protein [Dehalococcoidia bacterium]|nr:endonuclease domain-containing protein [Dehalococcoidia bacterium]
MGEGKLKNPHETKLARSLRRNQSDAERNLWSTLRNSQIDGVKFRRQQPIGNYIVDFISFDKKLIIEVDGGHHNEEPVKILDEQRTKYLESRGFRVIRFWNDDVLTNMDGVFLMIKEVLGETQP